MVRPSPRVIDTDASHPRDLQAEHELARAVPERPPLSRLILPCNQRIESRLNVGDCELVRSAAARGSPVSREYDAPEQCFDARAVVGTRACRSLSSVVTR